MPAAVSIRQRQEIIERREKGEQFTTIAQALHLSYSAVRNIYHRYVQTGEIAPAYDKCCHTEIRKDDRIYRRAVDIKQAHPGWGAGLIWVELAEEFVEADLPSHRTLQRWFRRAGVQPASRERRPRPYAQRGKRVHEVWAMDAKEQMELADGSYASWLTVTDEASGAVLGTTLFPPSTVEQYRPTPSQKHAPRPDGVLGTTGEDTHG